MSARSTLHRLCVFLTPEDEAQLSAALRIERPTLRYLGPSQQSETGTPRFSDSLTECTGPHVTLVDTSIMSESEFHREYVVPHPSDQGWIFAIVGTGLASLVRSRFEGDGFRNGELRASVPTGDTRTDEYVSELMRVVRAGGKRVYGVDPNTKNRPRRVERNFVAWPDAARRFGASDAPLLTNGPPAWFSTER